MTAITDLYLTYTYPDGMTDLPLVILMHGWSGDTTNMTLAIRQRIANRKLFVAAVGMRARDGADGSKDASGRELYDIYDAITALRTAFGSVISADKVVVAGYSGGGGNALGLACKFPDAFSVIASHYGMSDYGYDGTFGWYQQNATYRAEIAAVMGGIPADIPNRYRARNAVEAVINYSGGHLYLFHDSGDTTVDITQSQRIGDALDAAGYTNFTESYTGVGDSPRWTHGDPTGAPQEFTEQYWAERVKTQAAWTVPASGTHRVIGYIVTKRYTCWLRANGTTAWGVDAVADVAYDTTADSYTVTPLTGALDVQITQGVKTGSATNINAATVIGVT